MAKAKNLGLCRGSKPRPQRSTLKAACRQRPPASTGSVKKTTKICQRAVRIGHAPDRGCARRTAERPNTPAAADAAEGRSRTIDNRTSFTTKMRLPDCSQRTTASPDDLSLA